MKKKIYLVLSLGLIFIGIESSNMSQKLNSTNEIRPFSIHDIVGED